MEPLLNVTETARRLGLMSRNGEPSRNALYRHIKAHGPVLNGVAFAVQINGHWRGVPDAIERIRRGEIGATHDHAA